jgi:hypothetical protein
MVRARMVAMPAIKCRRWSRAAPCVRRRGSSCRHGRGLQAEV